MSKKSAESSPLTTQNQASVITESSGRPPTIMKKQKVAGHTKNSMSTHIKQNENYFYTQDEEMLDDMDEFPTEPVQAVKKRHTHYEKQPDDSSLFKYKEYKKMYFDDATQKKNKKIMEANYATEQNKYKKLLNSHFNKGNYSTVSIINYGVLAERLFQSFDLINILVTSKQPVSKKNKCEYFNETSQNQPNRNVIKFDVLSSEPQSNASKASTVKQSRKSSENRKKDQNIIDKIVIKHAGKDPKTDVKEEKKFSSKLYQYSEPKLREDKPEDFSVVKSGSLVSFEYNRNESQSKFYQGETSNRNESYEIMELNSFNEVKNSDE